MLGPYLNFLRFPKGPGWGSCPFPWLVLSSQCRSKVDGLLTCERYFYPCIFDCCNCFCWYFGKKLMILIVVKPIVSSSALISSEVKGYVAKILLSGVQYHRVVFSQIYVDELCDDLLTVVKCSCFHDQSDFFRAGVFA